MMERVLCFVFAFLLIGVVSGQMSQICPADEGWIKFGEKCYKFISFPTLKYASATATCREDGATLVSINTAQEHSFVANWLLRNDQRRDQWLTSGVTTKNAISWLGDGTTGANLDKWSIPSIERDEGLHVIYNFTGAEYLWKLGKESDPFSFICEISVNEVYRIRQQHRDFDYGLDVENAQVAPRGPKLLQEPQDTTILGQTNYVFMECLADGNPKPTYEWLKGNSPDKMVLLTQSQKYSFTTGKLEISNPNQADETSYQCRVSNDHGTIMSRTAKLAFGELGEFSNVPPENVNGFEYDGAVLECPNIVGRPGISYQWYKDQLNFIRPNFQTHTFISTNGRLYFSELATSDAGTYYCMATLTNYGVRGAYIGSTQTVSRVSLGFSLNVASGGGKQYQPIIQNKFINVYPTTPVRGFSVKLECFAYGTGPLMYRWWRSGDKPLPNGHSFDSSNRILQLQNVELVDGGGYYCEVYSSSTNQRDQKFIDLVIQSKPYFTYPLQHQHMDIGTRLTWHCEAAGQPLPTYRWYKNGKILASSAGITISSNSLTIDAVDPARDNGMYQCQAQNSHGTEYSTAQLRVLQIVPSFVKSPMAKTLSGAISGQATILCNPVAAPSPTYTWLKDGSNLNLQPGVSTQEDHYRLLLNGNLVIQNINRADQGRYVCKAENSLGVAEDYTNLVVLEKTVLSVPPSDEKVEVNLTATLECRASHSPAIDMIYVWTFNDHVIDYIRQPEYRLGEGSQQGSLYIIAARFDNEGQYTCTATTGMDSMSDSAYLTVLGPPGEPAGVLVQMRSMLRNLPSNPDGLDEANTTRWIIWTDGADHGGIITHYFVEFSTTFDQEWRTHPDGNNLPKFSTTNEQYKDHRYARLTKLKAGAGIQFRVRARNAYGIGAPSMPTAVTQIAAARPTEKIKNIRGGGGSVGDLTVLWDPLPQEDHNGPDLMYNVSWRSKEAGQLSETAKWREQIVNHKDVCMTVPDYILGLVYLCKIVDLVGAENYYKPYEVVISAKNSRGSGPATDVVTVMSAEEMPIGAPENVYALAYNSTALLVTWKPVPNDRTNVKGQLKGYKINYWRYKIDLEIQALQNIIELRPGQNNLAQGLIIGLEPVEWYAFNVQIYNSAGNGPKSSEYQQQTRNRIPSQYPTEVHVYSVEGFGVRVNFRGVSTQPREEPLQGYKVQYWKAYENILNAREVDFGRLNTGVIRNLTSSELYELRVFAYSRAGQGKRSSPTVYFTVGDGQIVLNPETTEIFGGAPTLHASLLLYLAAAVITVMWSSYIS